jgi:AraC family transcriptional regulator
MRDGEVRQNTIDGRFCRNTGSNVMTDEGLYGDRLAKIFPMIQSPHPGIIKSLQRGTFAAARLAYAGPDGGPTLPPPPDDAFALCLRLRQQRAEVWLDGHSARKGVLKDETSVYDLQCETIVHFKDPFDFLYLYMPRSVLAELADEQGVSHVRYDIATGTSILDPVVAHLGACLLPALEQPHQASEIFVGYVAMALHTHFLRKYAGTLPAPRCRRSGLAPWQLRTAKALINAHLDGNVSLAHIASECGLSASHFARAFTVSLGKPPHRWLMDQRINRGKELLLNSALSVTEIALLCGFSDQSHFTRVFSAKVGASPGYWRRVRKN